MRDHAVRLFKVADMLNGRSEPHAVLAGRGLSAQQVAFVDKGTGLWLGDRAGERPLSGGWLFGFDSRRIDANEDGKHALDRPDAGDWSFQVDDDGKGVRVRRGQKEMPPVRLRGADEVVTAVALRPPAGGNPGLLAVAYTERQSARTLILLS